MLTTTLSVATFIIAVLALMLAAFTWRYNTRATREIQHYSVVAQADRMLAGNENFLRFHGIEPGEIREKYGVTSEELSYLLQSFNSGSISNKLSREKRKSPFEKGSYWYEMLRHESTRKAFPLIRLFFDTRNPYMDRCEKTIDVIETVD